MSSHHQSLRGFLSAIPKQHALGSILACIVSLTLSGCCIPVLNHPDRGPDLPEHFNGTTTSDSSGDVGLFEFFTDPELAQLLTQGVSQNQELKIRNQEIQIAGNEIMARRGAYLPFLGIGTKGGFDKTSKFTPLGAAEDQLTFPGGGRFSDPLGNVGLSANLFWQIDLWGQLRKARSAAEQRYIEATEARNFLITKLVAETAENYYELTALDKRLEFLDQTIQLQQQSLEVAKDQKIAGRGTELAVQRFLAEVRKNESQRLIVKQKIVETENRINVLAGRFPQRIGRTSWDFVNLDANMLRVGFPAQLLHNRRDIRAAERELVAAGLDVEVAEANFYPKLFITAGIGYEAFNPKYLFDPEAFVANVAGELTAPVINRAAIKAEYLNANAKQLQAVYTYQRTVLKAFAEVVNSTNKVDNYRESVAIKQGEVKALEKSVDVARELFKAPLDEEFARVEYVDVLLATRDLLEARTALLETKQQQLSGIVNAYQALGGGYLLTGSGDEFPEFFCEPMEVQLPPVPAPTPVPVEAKTPPAVESEEPGKVNVKD